MPEARFVVVGQGPMENVLKRRAAELGLDGHVVFTGYREDALRIANTFDLFVLASIQEGLSIALIEAMALGKSAVVTSVGGLPEVVEDGFQGIVVPPRDPDSLADAIVRMLRDDQLRNSFGLAARERARDFDIHHAVDRVEGAYQDLLR
jgi:glycosyltransferase involved in cell wall biosynthesis